MAEHKKEGVLNYGDYLRVAAGMDPINYKGALSRYRKESDTCVESFGHSREEAEDQPK